MANRVKDITGEKFGKLTVLKRDGYTNGKRKSILWLCKCDCGNEVLRTSAHLKQNYNSTRSASPFTAQRYKRRKNRL